MVLIHAKLRKVAGGVKVFRLAPMQHFATITVIGRDKTGVVARITNFLFLQKANIEALEEQVTRGQFSMTVQASWKDATSTGTPSAAAWRSWPPNWRWRSRSASPNRAAASAWPSW